MRPTHRVIGPPSHASFGVDWSSIPEAGACPAKGTPHRIQATAVHSLGGVRKLTEPHAITRSEIRWADVERGAQLADLKLCNYRYMLALSALVELLIEKGILRTAEWETKSQELDRQATKEATEIHDRVWP